MKWGKRRTGCEADGTKHDEAGKLPEGISLQHVSKRLGGVSVLSGINLHVEAGECAVLVGRNGSGKSTLLRTLAGFLVPDHGVVCQTINEKKMYALDGLPRLPFTSAEYLWEMGRIRGIRPALLRQRINELSELLFLGSALDQKLSLLSKGTLQKVNLIQAMLPGPDGLMLLDEPLSGLDLPAQEAVVTLLQQWKKEGTSIVTACHEPLFIERMADQVYVLQNGRVLRHWKRDDLKELGEPIVQIQSLMKGSNMELLNTYSNLVEQEGVLQIHRHGEMPDRKEVVWDWKVERSTTDHVIHEIIAAGGSIVSVLQEESRVHMERLLEGHHPADHRKKSATEPAFSHSRLDTMEGESP